MRVEGTLERREVEGGTWFLRTAGASWVLIGAIPQELAGRRVIVEGEPDEGFGIGMAGPQLAVRSIRSAP